MFGTSTRGKCLVGIMNNTKWSNLCLTYKGRNLMILQTGIKKDGTFKKSTVNRIKRWKEAINAAEGINPIPTV